MDHLDYYLARPVFATKRPTLILTIGQNKNGAEQLKSAVLLYEYQVRGVGCRLFSADFHGSVRTVIAPEEARAHVAFAASAALMQRGALFVQLSYEGKQVEANEVSPLPLVRKPRLRWISSLRKVPGYLPVESSIDATLANMGKHTRRNLRYYRRRVEADFGVRFVPSVEISQEDFLEANRLSTNPTTDDIASDRLASVRRLKQPLFAGLRAANGEWLSLIGGRKHEGTTEIDWQLNRAGLSRYSLSTAMRAFLLEYEGSVGTTKLAFEGGTPHSMRLSFVDSAAVDILVRREGLLDWALGRFADRLFPEKSFVRELLADKNLQWAPWERSLPYRREVFASDAKKMLRAINPSAKIPRVSTTHGHAEFLGG